MDIWYLPECRKIFSIQKVYKPQDVFQHEYAIFIQLSSSARGTIEPAEEVPGEDGEGGTRQGEHEHHQHHNTINTINEGLVTFTIAFPNSALDILSGNEGEDAVHHHGVLPHLLGPPLRRDSLALELGVGGGKEVSGT